ncbi:MAG: hypothetical protein ABL930_08750 [Pseudobdellovibrio sp.]
MKNMKNIKLSFVCAVLTLICINTSAATSCRIYFNENNSRPTLSEQQVLDLVDKSKSYQDKRNQEWSERNKCLCCHTTLPYILARGMDPASKTNFDKFKEIAAQRVENTAELPWYHSDMGGRNSKPTEAVVQALTLLMHDIASNNPLSSTTLKSIDRIFENMNTTGRIHWLDFNLQPFESKKGEFWGNSMAILAVEMAQKNSQYVAPADKYNKLKEYVLRNTDKLKPNEMSVLIWANSMNLHNARITDKLLTSDLYNRYISSIVASQNANGSWNQKAVLGQGKNNEDVYSTAIALIGLIKGGQGNIPSVHKAANWLAAQQQTGNLLSMGDGSTLWVSTSMNRENALFNNRFASDFATSYASLALQFYKSDVMTLPPMAAGQ